jgi:hypothetical protein
MKNRIGLVAVAALVLAACGVPVPADKAAYVGQWRSAETGPQVVLLIAPEGRIEYLRKEGSTSTELNVPMQGFIGDDFEAGIGWMKTRFVVSAPPRQDGATWKMTVDGVELTKVAPGAGMT